MVIAYGVTKEGLFISAMHRGKPAAVFDVKQIDGMLPLGINYFRLSCYNSLKFASGE
jgi:hypothetical protein